MHDFAGPENGLIQLTPTNMMEFFRSSFAEYDKIKAGYETRRDLEDGILRQQIESYIFILNDSDYGVGFARAIQAMPMDLIIAQFKAAIGTDEVEILGVQEGIDAFKTWAAMIEEGGETVLRAVMDYPALVDKRELGYLCNSFLVERAPVSTKSLITVLGTISSDSYLDQHEDQRDMLERLAVFAAKELSLRVHVQRKMALTEATFILGHEKLLRHAFLPCRYVSEEEKKEAATLCEQLNSRLITATDAPLDASKLHFNDFPTKIIPADGSKDFGEPKEVYNGDLGNHPKEVADLFSLLLHADVEVRSFALSRISDAVQFASEKHEGEIILTVPGTLAVAGCVPIPISNLRAKQIGEVLHDCLIKPEVMKLLKERASEEHKHAGMYSSVYGTAVALLQSSDKVLGEIHTIPDRSEKDNRLIEVARGFGQGLSLLERINGGCEDSWLEQCVHTALENPQPVFARIVAQALQHRRHLNVEGEVGAALLASVQQDLERLTELSVISRPKYRAIGSDYRLNIDATNSLAEALAATKSYKAVSPLLEAALTVCRHPLSQEYHMHCLLSGIINVTQQHIESLTATQCMQLDEIVSIASASTTDFQRSELRMLAAATGGAKHQDELFRQLRDLSKAKNSNDIQLRDRILLKLLPSFQDKDIPGLIKIYNAKPTAISTLVVQACCFHKGLGAEGRQLAIQEVSSDRFHSDKAALSLFWSRQMSREAGSRASFAHMVESVVALSIVNCLHNQPIEIYQQSSYVEKRADFVRKVLEVIDPSNRAHDRLLKLIPVDPPMPE